MAIGAMIGIDMAIKYLEACEPRFSGDDTPGRIINRLRYLQAKDEGVRPKFHKGIYGHKHDHWTCGNCGVTTKDTVLDNYCWNCGYKILWDSPRCLTGYKGEQEIEREKDGAEQDRTGHTNADKLL